MKYLMAAALHSTVLVGVVKAGQWIANPMVTCSVRISRLVLKTVLQQRDAVLRTTCYSKMSAQ